MRGQEFPESASRDAASEPEAGGAKQIPCLQLRGKSLGAATLSPAGPSRAAEQQSDTKQPTETEGSGSRTEPSPGSRTSDSQPEPHGSTDAAFAKIFTTEQRNISVALAANGCTTREILQSLLASMPEPAHGEHQASCRHAGPNPACKQGGRPLTEPRHDERGSNTGQEPPREQRSSTGLCGCGRTLAMGGGRTQSFCCRHCPSGTHSECCERRERRRQQALRSSAGQGPPGPPGAG